jgi:D-3-phosphoglycerate dehydrogenase
MAVGPICIKIRIIRLMKNVLITEPMHEAGLALLRQRPDIKLIQISDIGADTLKAAARDAHAIGVRTALLGEDVLTTAGNLQVVSRHGVGTDNIDVDYLTTRSIPVAIATDANAQSVTEHTIMMMLAASRRLFAQDKAVREGDFAVRTRIIGGDLFSRNALIIGFGRIGRRIAAMCRAFGMNVTVADIALDREHAASLGCRAVEDFRPELAAADFVSLHVPLNSSTRHLLSATEFAVMRPGAIVINCARGSVLDETALAAALESGHLAGAGLDVFEDEPAPADHPLFSRPDVIVTPHTAGTSHNALRASAEMVAQNILDCFDGRLRRDCVFNKIVLDA